MDDESKEVKIPVYRIDSNVPLPEDREALVPLAQLRPKESIVFPIEMRGRVQSQASALARRTGREFTVRKQDEETARVWRLV